MAQTNYTPILLYASGTATNVPLAANMTSSASGAELALNYADGKLFYKDSGGVVQVLATKGAGTIGGSNTQVQYNSSGALAGSANLTFNGTTVTMANDASISGLTVGKGAGAVSNNTAVGASALSGNTSGASNTSLGYQALNSNTTASSNTAVGYQAAYSGTTATQVVAVGSGALYANTVNYGTAVGFNALTANTTGAANAAFGAYALSTNTTGAGNSAFGALGFGLSNSALQANTTGSYNSAFGLGALASNTTASNNTAVGYQAGYTNTTGTRNALLGYVAGYSLTGNYCTLIGAGAGYSTTGDRNTFVGDYAGNLITTGTRNTIIGKYDGNTGGLDIRTSSNYIVLSDGDGNARAYFDNNGSLFVGSFNPRYGTNIYYPNYDVVNAFTAQAAGNSRSLYTGWYSASTTTTGTLAFNVTSNGNVTNINNSYGAISDAKLKHNITLSGSQWNDVKALGSLVKKYSLIIDETNTQQIGWIAQDAQTVSPGLVYSTPDKDIKGNLTGESTLGINYSVAYMKAFKALSEALVRIEQLETQVTALQTKVGV